MVDAVVDEVPEVGANGGFTAADVDVEHLHSLEFVDYSLGFNSGELAGVADSRRRQAVDALQIACVGELPGEADGSVEPGLHLCGDAGHEATKISDSASEARAFSKLGQRR